MNTEIEEILKAIFLVLIFIAVLLVGPSFSRTEWLWAALLFYGWQAVRLYYWDKRLSAKWVKEAAKEAEEERRWQEEERLWQEEARHEALQEAFPELTDRASWRTLQ